MWNDKVLTAGGSLAARARGEPVSAYAYTDDEAELRDRAWRFIMPSHERSWFDGIVSELVRTRALPASARPRDRMAYHGALVAEDVRSPASRYNRVTEDAMADAGLIGPFATVAARVIATDGVRLRSLPFVRDVTEDEVANAHARVAENRCLIAWVRQETADRADGYQYALERLFIEAPQNQAVAAERAVALLAEHRKTLDAFAVPPLASAACAGSDGPLNAPRPGGPAAPIVAKG